MTYQGFAGEAGLQRPRRPHRGAEERQERGGGLASGRRRPRCGRKRRRLLVLFQCVLPSFLALCASGSTQHISMCGAWRYGHRNSFLCQGRGQWSGQGQVRKGWGCPELGGGVGGSGHSRPPSGDGPMSICTDVAETDGEPGVLDDAGLRLERWGAVPTGPSGVDRPGALGGQGGFSSERPGLRRLRPAVQTREP